MNQNELAERLLLTHPSMRDYYLKKYELYTFLKLSFKLFFVEDVFNFNNDLYCFDFINANFLEIEFDIKRPLFFKSKFRRIIYAGNTNTVATSIKDNDILIIKDKMIRTCSIHVYNNSGILLYYVLSSIFSEKKFSPEQQELLKIINKIYNKSKYTLNDLAEIVREIELVNHEPK